MKYWNNINRSGLRRVRGIGVSTFLLRWVAYCCFNMFPANSRVGIIVGPRMELAIDLIDRFKALFDKIAPGLFDGSKSTEAIINHNITVSAFPVIPLANSKRFGLSEDVGD